MSSSRKLHYKELEAVATGKQTLAKTRSQSSQGKDMASSKRIGRQQKSRKPEISESESESSNEGSDNQEQEVEELENDQFVTRRLDTMELKMGNMQEDIQETRGQLKEISESLSQLMKHMMNKAHGTIVSMEEEDNNTLPSKPQRLKDKQKKTSKSKKEEVSSEDSSSDEESSSSEEESPKPKRRKKEETKTIPKKNRTTTKTKQSAETSSSESDMSDEDQRKRKDKKLKAKKLKGKSLKFKLPWETEESEDELLLAPIDWETMDDQTEGSGKKDLQLLKVKKKRIAKYDNWNQWIQILLRSAGNDTEELIIFNGLVQDMYHAHGWKVVQNYLKLLESEQRKAVYLRRKGYKAKLLPYDEVVTHLLLNAQALAGKQNDPPGKRSKLRCYNCGEEGHTKSKCPKLEGKPKNFNSKKSTEVPQEKKVVKCLKCFGTGHTKESCPTKAE